MKFVRHPGGKTAREPVVNDVRNKQFYRKMALEDLFAHGFSPEFSLWWIGLYDRDTGKIAWDRPNSTAGPPEQFLQLVKDSPFGRKGWLWADAGFTRIYVQVSGEESHLPPKAGVEGWKSFLRYVRKNRDRWPNIYTAHTRNTDWGYPIALAECLGHVSRVLRPVFRYAQQRLGQRPGHGQQCPTGLE